MKYKRIFLIVIDSVGIGYSEDSYKFKDEGAKTLQHIAEYNRGIYLPNMEKLGLGKIDKILGVKDDINTIGYYTKMRESSSGKDTMTGHWEMMGVLTTKPFKTFTDTGFPKELMDELSLKTGRKLIGNYAASGTKIIEDLGKEMRETGSLIVYTSADPVLQIAADEDIIPLKDLYRYCEIAREITLKEEWKVGRIIARPFIVRDNKYIRTTNRHDYALTPPFNALNKLYDNDYKVISVGKIADIFNHSGIHEEHHIVSNHDGMNITTDIVKNNNFTGLCFVNLVDFDALYGHRRDPIGYKNSLEEFDKDLGILMNELKEDDLLMVTADHGNDPTWTGTDHTREFVPLLCYSKSFKASDKLEIRNSFGDLSSTILSNFSLDKMEIGESFLEELK